VNINDNVEVKVRARLNWDEHAFGSGDSVSVNATALTWDADNSWFEGLWSKSTVGNWIFEVSSGSEATYGITAIYHGVAKPDVVWYNIAVSGKGVTDSRADINSYQQFWFTLRSDYDNTAVQSGTVTLNGTLSASWISASSRWEYNTTKVAAQKLALYVALLNWDTYGITSLSDQSSNSTSVIWDARNVTSLAFIPLGDGNYNFTVLYNYAYNNSEVIANCQVGILFPNSTLYTTITTNSSGYAMFRLSQPEILTGSWVLYGHNETLYGITSMSGNQTLSLYSLTFYTTKWTGETFGEGTITMKYSSEVVNQPSNGTEYMYPTNWTYLIEVVWQNIKVNETSSYSFSSNTTQALKLNIWNMTFNAKDGGGTLLNISPSEVYWTFSNNTQKVINSTDGTREFVVMNGTHYYQVKFQGQWISENVTISINQANKTLINKNCWVYSLTVYVTSHMDVEMSGAGLTL